MTDVDKLREEELRQLNDDEIFDLEALVTDGVDAKVPIVIKYPKTLEDGTVKMVKAGAMIRPLTNVEWNNSTRLNRSTNAKTTNEVELLKKALYTRNGEQMPAKVVEDLPSGVVTELVKEVAVISGIDVEENMRLAKEMLGFSA